MKILIVSDTHGHTDKLEYVINKESPFDMFIHLGDIEDGDYVISRFIKGPYEVVSGNNDFFCRFEREKEITIGKYKIFMTHGHKYCVNAGSDIIRDEGLRRGADIVMYGHTHIPVIERELGITVLNPGSLTYPRQIGRRPSYIVMEIDRFDEAHFDIRYL